MGKILVLGERPYRRLHSHLGEVSAIRDIQDFFKSPEDYSLVVFSGGADISPSLYGENENSKTFTNPARDRAELSIFNFAKRNHIPCVGICRGGQFLHVMAGGFLYQHVSNHGIWGTHPLETSDGRIVEVTSTHHQMFGYPLPAGSQLLAWAHPRRSNTYQDGEGEEHPIPKYEPDVVFHPHIRSLSVQYHPEVMEHGSDGREYYLELLDTFIKPLMEKDNNERCIGTH